MMKKSSLEYSLQSFSKNTINKNHNFHNPTFVLFCCEKESTKSIIKKIKTISIVSEVKQVIGIYDIVIQLDSNSFDEIKKP